MNFQEADRRYVEIKRRGEAGELTQEEFDEQLKQLMVQDEDGQWWVKSPTTGEWHYHDGTAWVKDTPPGYEAPQDTLANVRFYDSQHETFRRLADMTWRAKRVVKATRFSPGDITRATGEYWQEIKEKAYDPSVRSIRIHSLAHPTKGPVNNLSKLVEQLKDAKNFQLGIAFFENEFEIIIADDQECIVCFHQPGEIIGNGLHFDSTLPKGEGIVDKFVHTFGDMRERCHVLVDFDEWVSTPDDIKKLQAFINRAHDQYLAGTEPANYGVDPEFLRDEVFS